MRAAQQILSVDENLGAKSRQNEEHSEHLDFKIERTDAQPGSWKRLYRPHLLSHINFKTVFRTQANLRQGVLKP